MQQSATRTRVWSDRPARPQLSRGSVTRLRYIFQRINQYVFRDPEALMDNIQRVTTEVRRQLMASGVPDPTRGGLTVVPAKDGRPFVLDDEGSCWRCYLFIEGAATYDAVTEPRMAYEAGSAHE